MFSILLLWIDLPQDNIALTSYLAFAHILIPSGTFLKDIATANPNSLFCQPLGPREPQRVGLVPRVRP